MAWHLKSRPGKWATPPPSSKRDPYFCRKLLARQWPGWVPADALVKDDLDRHTGVGAGEHGGEGLLLLRGMLRNLERPNVQMAVRPVVA